jgi:hypothetical protein
MRAANRSHPSLIPRRVARPSRILLILIKRGQTITPGRGEAVGRMEHEYTLVLCVPAPQKTALPDTPRDIR